MSHVDQRAYLKPSDEKLFSVDTDGVEAAA